MLTSLPKDTQYSVGNTEEFQKYENNIVSLYASSIYQSTQYYACNVVQVLLNTYFVFAENARNWYITQTLKVPNTKITKVHITGAEHKNNCIKNFVVYYLDNKTNEYIELYRDICTETLQEFKIEIPKDIITQSIKIVPLDYHIYGPGLNGFVLEYEKIYSNNIFNKATNVITNHPYIQRCIIGSIEV